MNNKLKIVINDEHEKRASSLIRTFKTHAVLPTGLYDYKQVNYSKQHAIEFATQIWGENSLYVEQLRSFPETAKHPNVISRTLEMMHRAIVLEIEHRPWDDSIWGRPSADKQFECDVFMVMPFKQELDSTYNSIKKVSVNLNLTMKRGDDPYSKNDIMHDIWSLIYNCDLVIADCTGQNSNVFYELGIAHTLKKFTILLAQNIEDIPFDLRHRRFIIYDSADLRELEHNLKSAIQKLL